MEILLIPLGIIALFLYIPFGLAKWTEAENKKENYVSIGFKAAGYHMSGLFGIGLFPLLVIIWTYGQWENQYISAVGFTVTFYTLFFVNSESKRCFKEFKKFKYITHSYAALGLLFCLLMFNFVGGLLLTTFCFYWFIQLLVFLGKRVRGRSR